MKKRKLIGKGMTAEVYEWGQDKVLKLYYNCFKDEWIKYEAEIGYTIHEAGVPSPAVFEMIEIDGRKGVVFQRIYGKSMLKHVEAEPWKINYFAQQMAGLHFNMHKCSADKLASQKDRFVAAIKDSCGILGDREKRILDYLESLPCGTSVCHGDLHFDNIIVSNNGLVAIDWTNAYKGNPLGDVARTCLMISSPTLPPGTFSTIIAPYRYAKQLTYKAYLNEYMRLAKVRYESIAAWMLPVAAARLREKISGEEKWLLGIIDKNLKS